MPLVFPEFGHGQVRKLPPHLNGGLEIVHVEQGVLHWQVEGRVEVVPAGSVFFTFPWETHGSVAEWEPGHRWSFVVLALEHTRKVDRLRWPTSLKIKRSRLEQLSDQLLRASRRSWPAGDDLPWLMPRLVRALSSTESTEEIHALLVLVLLELGRVVDPCRRAGLDVGDARIFKLQQRIRECPFADWSLPALEQKSGLARSRLDELFRRQSGDSPVSFVRRIRIEKAGEYLRESRKSVTEVAHACGFCSSQHFAKVFRRIYGCTPSAFRGK